MIRTNQIYFNHTDKQVLCFPVGIIIWKQIYSGKRNLCVKDARMQPGCSQDGPNGAVVSSLYTVYLFQCNFMISRFLSDKKGAARKV